MTTLFPLPIQTVLSTTTRHGVRALLMGGQACVVHGASEFSRDVDLAILAESENFERLRAALRDLHATVIAVPPFMPEYLARGHAVHFRCGAASNMRLDVMSVMRGVADFDTCWSRRMIAPLEGIGDVDVLGIEDLVNAKKTRRDKDWPMIRRLVDVHYSTFADEPTEARRAFWLRELRTPDALIDCVRRDTPAAVAATPQRAVISAAIAAMENPRDLLGVHTALAAEENAERAADESYWRPLLTELEMMRRAAHRPPSTRPADDGGAAI
jgi:hypothetical protein